VVHPAIVARLCQLPAWRRPRHRSARCAGNLRCDRRRTRHLWLHLRRGVVENDRGWSCTI